MTTQQADELHFVGRWFLVDELPLELLFEQSGEERPDFVAATQMLCSACWRGYIARWYVAENLLCLMDVLSPDASMSISSAILPSMPMPCLVHWFSGCLKLKDPDSGKEVFRLDIVNGVLYGNAQTQKCTGCGLVFPLTREFFGNTPSLGFRRKCRTCMTAHTKKDRASKPEMERERVRRRGLLEIDAGPRWTEADVSRIRTAQKDKCAYCCEHLRGGGEIDHMKPLSRGGTNDIGNLVLACFRCNGEKHAKTVQEYFEWRVKRGMLPSREAYGFRSLYDAS